MSSHIKPNISKLVPPLFSVLLFFSFSVNSTAQTFPEIVKYLKERVVKVNSKVENRFGSGFFINKNGYILTCAHVLKNDTAKTYEREFTVELFGEYYQFDGVHGETTLVYYGATKFDAKVDTIVEEFDLAILKADLKTVLVPSKIPYLTQVAWLSIGESKKMGEGDEIATCGFIPDGFNPPRPIVVKGMISVIREGEYLSRLKKKVDILQLDQQTAGGLSGSPVFSAKSGVVGYMDAAILADQRTKQSGFSYALAIDQVKELLSKYITTDKTKQQKP